MNQESIFNLNRITDILINQDPHVISSQQITSAITIQKLKTEKLFKEKDSRFIYALVMLQTLYYLQNRGVEGSLLAIEAFAGLKEAVTKVQQVEIEMHSKSLYQGYADAMPEIQYQLPIDSLDEDLILLQEAIFGEKKAQVKLALKFKNMSPPNDQAGDYWLMKASNQTEKIDVIDISVPGVPEEEKDKEKPVNPVLSRVLDEENNVKSKRSSVLSFKDFSKMYTQDTKRMSVFSMESEVKLENSLKRSSIVHDKDEGLFGNDLFDSSLWVDSGFNISLELESKPAEPVNILPKDLKDENLDEKQDSTITKEPEMIAVISTSAVTDASKPKESNDNEKQKSSCFCF